MGLYTRGRNLLLETILRSVLQTEQMLEMSFGIAHIKACMPEKCGTFWGKCGCNLKYMQKSTHRYWHCEQGPDLQETLNSWTSA